MQFRQILTSLLLSRISMRIGIYRRERVDDFFDRAFLSSSAQCIGEYEGPLVQWAYFKSRNLNCLIQTLALCRITIKIQREKQDCSRERIHLSLFSLFFLSLFFFPSSLIEMITWNYTRIKYIEVHDITWHIFLPVTKCQFHLMDLRKNSEKRRWDDHDSFEFDLNEASDN